MNTVARFLLFGTAIGVLGGGCARHDQPGPSVAKAQVIAPVTPIQQAPSPDPSLPDAATALAADDAAGSDATKQDTTALQQKSSPQGEMNKEEESKAMPLPSQANDHSNTALDASREQTKQD